MLFLCVLHIYCCGDLDNLIGRSNMMILKIGMHWKRIWKDTHLHHCHLDKCMRINWSWRKQKKSNKPCYKIMVRIWGQVKQRWVKSVKHQGVNFHPLKINLKASSKINKKIRERSGVERKWVERRRKGQEKKSV